MSNYKKKTDQQIFAKMEIIGKQCNYHYSDNGLKLWKGIIIPKIKLLKALSWASGIDYKEFIVKELQEETKYIKPFE